MAESPRRFPAPWRVDTIPGAEGATLCDLNETEVLDRWAKKKTNQRKTSRRP
jgi:hypothetical protein